MNVFCKINMPLTHRLSLLYIILISGFKLGIAAPTDDIKGKMIIISDSFNLSLLKSDELCYNYKLLRND